MGTMAAAGAHAAARPAGFPRATAKVFGRFGLSRRRAAPILRAPRAVAGGVSRHPRRAGESSPIDAPDARLEELLSKVRAALGVSGAADAHDSAMIWGEGENLGMPTRWCLRHDGARFLEEAIGPELSYVSGCDYVVLTGDESLTQKHQNTVWETDFSGYTQVLALDDREAALLFGWTRSHFWCKPSARKWLRLEILYDDDILDDSDDDDSDSDETIRIGARLNDGVLNATIFIDAKTYLPKRMTARVCGDTEKWTFDEWAPLEDFVSPKSGEDSNPPPYDSSGKSSSKRTVASGAMYPGLTVLEGSAGGKQTFRVTRARCNSGATNPDAFYRAPFFSTEPSTETSTKKSANKLAGGVSFAPGVAPEVVIERARSSHVLVRPLIDGVDVGPFILDTGASGLVITKAAAARVADCASFGEVFVSGVSGKVPCRFRRASNMTLGPIVIDSPVFMEMALGGIVSGSVEPVAGIVGFDAFKSAIVEVGPGGAPVRIYDPRTFKPDANWAWHAIALVSNVPHAFATFSTVDDEDEDEDETSSSSEADFDGSVNRGPKKSSAVFMIDSGAGGADAIFHKRAVEALGLRRLMPPPAGGGARGASRVRGVGGSDGESSGATRAYRGELRWLELDKVSAPTRLDDETALSADANAKPFSPSTSTSKRSKSREKKKAKSERPAKKKGTGGRFENLNVLLAADAGFDLSEHSVGLICANVLNTRRVVYDVPNRRVAFLVDGADKSPCESLLCGVFDWESDEGDEVGDSESDLMASSRSETTGRADRSVTLPTPTTEELELFGDSVRFGQNE